MSIPTLESVNIDGPETSQECGVASLSNARLA